MQLIFKDNYTELISLKAEYFLVVMTTLRCMYI